MAFQGRRASKCSALVALGSSAKRSDRYACGSNPSAFAVSMSEYSRALAVAPATVQPFLSRSGLDLALDGVEATDQIEGRLGLPVTSRVSLGFASALKPASSMRIASCMDQFPRLSAANVRGCEMTGFTTLGERVTGVDH
jgi:hypothetical protein